MLQLNSLRNFSYINKNNFINCKAVLQRNIELSRNKRLFSSTSPSKMHFLQYTCKNNGPQRLGVQLSHDSDIIEISAVTASVPNNLVDFLKGGDEYMEKAKRIIAEAKSVVDPNEVNVLTPISKPDKILCVGLNYKSHCDEQKVPYPEEPIFFNKFPSTIVGPTDNVLHPLNSKALDWEIELGIVIGRQCRRVHKTDVNNYIFGYTVCQDISARDWQSPKKNGGQWLFAKSMDTFCPLGPAVVAKEFVCDPTELKLRCSVNGVVMQEGNTSDMVHDVYDIVSFLSHCITLLPGDVILTGTPSGVGLFRKPRIFLKAGDVIESEIIGLGKLCNTIVE